MKAISLCKKCSYYKGATCFYVLGNKVEICPKVKEVYKVEEQKMKGNSKKFDSQVQGKFIGEKK